MARLRMAVIGVGHLGKEHARILASLPEVELVGVVDTNAEQAQAVAQQCGTRAFSVSWPLLTMVDAAVVAVPTSCHHAEAKAFLERAIPLLVEKPLAPTLAEADELLDLAQRRGVLLQVGHVERFNPAFEELQRRPFQPKFIECERLGRFTGRSLDIGAVLDLMIHDLDLLLTLVQSPVASVQALGAPVLGGQEDLVNARLTFVNGCVANLTASRVSPRPRRCMKLWGPEGYARIDFSRRRLTLIQPSEQLRRHGLDPCALTPTARATLQDELFGRHLQVLELDCPQPADQLTRELQEFIHCVRHGKQPRVSGHDGRNAVALATLILDQIRHHLWEGKLEGPRGPAQLPAPCGTLFANEPREAAA